MTADEAEILDLTQTLLSAIAAGDWDTYQRLCDSRLTAFEPEARGHLVEGLAFHRFYFESRAYGAMATTISAPHIRLLTDDVALIAYTRLNQFLDPEGRAQTSAFQETRIWQRQSGVWQHIHFHRS